MVKQSRVSIWLALLFLYFAACTIADVGPIEETDAFNKALTASPIDLRGERIQQYGRVAWYPGADAYAYEKTSQEVATHVQGVVVLQETRLLLLVWDKDRYEVRNEFSYASVKDVRRRVWGVSERIVIESPSGTTNAFSFLSNNGIGVSRPRINQALAFLRTKIPSSDAYRDAP